VSETKIEWAHYTFNCWRGCAKVSPGCANCYAETMSRRNPKVLGEWGPDGTRVVAAEPYWRLPAKWDREAAAAGERRRVFCASLADVFENRPELVAPRVRLYHLIQETPNLDWLLLTKRPENVRRFHGGGGVPRSWPENMPPNVWLGTSVEDQARADERIPHLLRTPAAVRFLSCEPLLGPLRLGNWIARDCPSCGGVGPDAPGFGDADPDCRRCEGRGAPEDIHWAIVGGESGPGARPCDVNWVRSLVRQCREADVPCFVKQLGSRPVNDAGYSVQWKYRHPKGGDPAEWAEDLRVREFPRV
jgi:protein gp37